MEMREETGMYTVIFSHQGNDFKIKAWIEQDEDPVILPYSFSTEDAALHFMWYEYPLFVYTLDDITITFKN